MENIKRIQELIKLCNYHSKLYYTQDKPEITDKEYDKLYSELETLEQQTNYIMSSSPTQKVQGEIIDSLTKVQHTEPMLSAEKSKDITDVIKFMGNQNCVLSWKLDGLTLVLKYIDGKFLQAITRGGGDIGEDVTHTVRTFTNIPLTIEYKNYLEIRGEGLVTFKDFERINAELIAKGEEPYSSPRNLAAGSVRQLDATITKNRNLIFITFGIVKCDNYILYKNLQFEFLKSLGFDVVESVDVTNNNINNAIGYFKRQIETLDYLTDGLIFEFNDIIYGKMQGLTGHHTKNMFALKWIDETNETIFRGVELNTTRTGMVSITGLFDTTNIDGVEVSRASLHNYDIFEELELGVGDIVTVYRANAVIPQIEDNLTRSGAYKIDMHCPSCESNIIIRRPKEARFLFCENDNCPAKLINKVVHFCSKNAMNIDGFSEAGIELFISKGFIQYFDDIYGLEDYKCEILELEGWGDRSYNKLIQAIDKSRKAKLSSFIYALGIPNIGVSSSKTIAKYFNNNLQEFLRACSFGFNFSKLEDFGSITSESINKWYKDKNESRMWIYLIEELEIIQEEKKVNNTLTDLTGKTFVVTGEVTTYKNRNELGDLIISLNGKLSGSVSKNTAYLINSDITSVSGKNQKAKEVGVPIITEQQFNEMIGRKG